MFDMDVDMDMEEDFLGEDLDYLRDDLLDSETILEDLELESREVLDQIHFLEVSFYLDTEFEQIDLENTIPIFFQALVSFKVYSKTSINLT